MLETRDKIPPYAGAFLIRGKQLPRSVESTRGCRRRWIPYRYQPFAVFSRGGWKASHPPPTNAADPSQKKGRRDKTQLWLGNALMDTLDTVSGHGS